MSRACAHCMHYQPDKGDRRQAVAGECRRTAPQKAPMGGLRVWPIVRHNDWCGEFRQHVHI